MTIPAAPMTRTRRSTMAAATILLLALSRSRPEASAFAPPRSSSRPLFAQQSRAVVRSAAAARPQQSRRRGGSEGGRGGAVELRMSAAAPAAAATAGVAAIAGAISGGLFAGGLHAIAGPDHLAALLPRCCGQRWYRAGRIGALWGMGHGVSATILGVLAFGLKNRLSTVSGVGKVLHGASSAMEIAVGASLVFIGLLGMKEAREWESEIDDGPQKSLSAAAADPGIKVAQKRAVVFNGVLHGFSWDGAPSLAPAIAVATWRGNLTFLLSYALGTMGAMAIATTLIGEGTRRAGELLHRPDIPQKLSFASSIVAIAVGLFWCSLALK